MTTKKKVLVGTVVLALVGAGFLAWTRFRASSTLQKRTREWVEVQVVRGDLEVKVTAAGTVQPENRLEIKPPISGRVDEVKVHEGQVVKAGQVLAYMSSTERAALLDAANEQEIAVDTVKDSLMASVRFSGMIREDQHASPSSFTEIWHFKKNSANSRWLVAGIQAN